MKDTYGVLLVDDEPLARAYLRELLAEYPMLEVLGEAIDGFDALKQITALKPDLLFLDVQMPRITGIEMLELLAADGAAYRPQVIFTTAWDQYAIKAFDNEAIDYLLKPFTEERLATALARWKDKQYAIDALQAQQQALYQLTTKESSERIVVKKGSDIVFVHTKDILYLEAQDDFVSIVTPDGKYLKNRTLSHFEQILDPSLFCRVHRSWIVAVAQIRKLEPYQKNAWTALLHNGSQIPISAAGYAKLRQVLGL